MNLKRTLAAAGLVLAAAVPMGTVGGAHADLLPPPPPPSTTCDGYAVTILGTGGDDFGTNAIQGTAGNDVIHGLGGNDQISGNGGNDRICRGSGNDHIYGNDGHDRLFGQSGLDRLWGGYGDDRLVANDGVLGETVNGQGGTDACFYDNPGDNVYYCEPPAG